MAISLGALGIGAGVLGLLAWGLMGKSGAAVTTPKPAPVPGAKKASAEDTAKAYAAGAKDGSADGTADGTAGAAKDPRPSTATANASADATSYFKGYADAYGAAYETAVALAKFGKYSVDGAGTDDGAATTPAKGTSKSTADNAAFAKVARDAGYNSGLIDGGMDAGDGKSPSPHPRLDHSSTYFFKTNFVDGYNAGYDYGYTQQRAAMKAKKASTDDSGGDAAETYGARTRTGAIMVPSYARSKYDPSRPYRGMRPDVMWPYGMGGTRVGDQVLRTRQVGSFQKGRQEGLKAGTDKRSADRATGTYPDSKRSNITADQARPELVKHFGRGVNQAFVDGFVEGFRAGYGVRPTQSTSFFDFSRVVTSGTPRTMHHARR